MQTVLENTKTFRPSLAQKTILVPHPLPKSEVAAVPSISGVPAGTTTNFVVYYDPQLGRKGKALAKAILDDCEEKYDTLKGYFGVTPNNLPFTILLTTDDT